MIRSINNIKSTVEQILNEHPETRANDLKLILKTWESEGLILNPDQKTKLLKCSSPESIRRWRQKLQSAKYYLPSQKVLNARSEEADNMRLI